MDKLINQLFIALALCVMCASCSSPRKILYFQDIEEVKAIKIPAEYEPKIMKDDKLQIIVSGPDKTVVTPYNLTLYSGTNGINSVIPYLVDSDGNIDMPGIGRIHVEGMRRVELVDYITKTLKVQGLVKEPVVSVSFLNYRITVLGEVRSPGTYTMPSERTTILQAIGMAGDLALTGNHKKVMIIRDENGVQTHTTVDLTSAEVLNSPYFYMHQNDVIYVPQTTTRIAQGTSGIGLASAFLSLITTTIALLSIFK